MWRPVYAPAVAVPVGDFSITKREDATLQWAYKGHPLYTFREDYSPGDVNGMFADSSAQVALAYRHYMPEAVQVVRPTARGPLMVTADGKSVYAEAQYHLQYGGRSTRDGYYLPYDNAKAVGTRGCVDDCLKTWKPVLAPADAQPRGLWEITTRTDGAKQWVYKGAALYTYVGDKKLGDINGNNRHVAVYGDPQGKIDLSASGGEGVTTTGYDRGFGSGFYWHTVMLYTQMPAENPPPAGP
jgi:predicted lipoprotein with Yx(FWY)xxD motif